MNNSLNTSRIHWSLILIGRRTDKIAFKNQMKTTSHRIRMRVFASVQRPNGEYISRLLLAFYPYCMQCLLPRTDRHVGQCQDNIAAAEDKMQFWHPKQI